MHAICALHYLPAACVQNGQHRPSAPLLIDAYRLDNKRVYLAAQLAQFLIIENSSPPTADKDWTVPATAAGKCSSIFNGSAEAQMDNVTRERSPLMNAAALCASWIRTQSR
jgi:hypothetical protein